MNNSVWHSNGKALPSPQPSKDSQTHFISSRVPIPGLAGAGGDWCRLGFPSAGVPRAAAAHKRVPFPRSSLSRTGCTKGLCPINPWLCSSAVTCSGEGNSKALAELRDGNVLQLPEQVPGLWQGNVAQAELSGAPFE